MRTTNVLSAAIFGLFCVNGVLAAPVSKSSAPHSTAAGAGAHSSAAAGAGTATASGLDPVSTGTGNATTGSGSSSGSGAGSGPWFSVYTDKGPDPAPAVDKIKGFNVVIMSFILSSGAADMAMAWQQLPDSQRSTIKQQYKAAGIKLLVSAFGSTETPTTSNKDPKQLASTMAAWVKKYGVDGIDVDYEDIDAMNKADGKAEKWLVDFTNALRAELPQGQYILTHAPMAPWMGAGTQWKSGAYVTVNKQVGSKVDFYNVQFYNQGAKEYVTCDGLLTKSTSSNPKSSLFEIAANGFELNKLLIGKPGSEGTADATNGQMSTSMLAGCVSQAKGKGWKGGVMSWEYPDANSQWITAVRGSAFPVDGASSSTGPDSSSVTGSAAGPSSTDGSSIPDTGSPTGSADGSSATGASGSTGADTGSASETGADGDSAATMTDSASTAASTGADDGSGVDGASSDAGASGAANPTGVSSVAGAPTGVTAPTGITSTKGAPTGVGASTPTAATGAAKSFNNGMWTPDAAQASGAPATPTGKPSSKKQGRSKVVTRSRRHMVIRSQ